MKKFKDIALIVFVLSLTMLIFSCSKKTTEPEIEKVATPIFSPTAGAYDEVLHVTIQCSTKGATILYTIDGSKPDSSSLTYSAPIMVNSDATIIAQAFKDGWIESDIASANYTISLNIAEMIFVPGGTFTMGDTRGVGRSNELPTHDVTLNSFYLGKYQVTQGDYQDIMDSNPDLGRRVGNIYPVDNVSWYDAIKYCNLRSMKEGFTPVYSISGSTDPDDWGEVPDPYTYGWNSAICNWDANGYRLPTEAEWEYAACGATDDPDYLYSGSDNIDNVAWHYDNSDGSAQPVGSKVPNGLGIYDMSGNIWEWCWDWYLEEYYSISPSHSPTGPAVGASRMYRGGSWENKDAGCRNAVRNGHSPAFKSSSVGFRVCRSAE